MRAQLQGQAGCAGGGGRIASSALQAAHCERLRAAPPDLPARAAAPAVAETKDGISSLQQVRARFEVGGGRQRRAAT